MYLRIVVDSRMKTFNLSCAFNRAEHACRPAYWGFNASQDTFVSLLLGLLAPFVAIAVVGVRCPKARQRLSDRSACSSRSSCSRGAWLAGCRQPSWVVFAVL